MVSHGLNSRSATLRAEAEDILQASSSEIHARKQTKRGHHSGPESARMHYRDIPETRIPAASALSLRLAASQGMTARKPSLRNHRHSGGLLVLRIDLCRTPALRLNALERPQHCSCQFTHIRFAQQ